MRRETISAIRFGFGLRDGQTAPVSTDALLQSADQTSRKSPRIALAARAEQLLANRMMRKESEEAKKRAERALRETAIRDVRHHIASAVDDAGFGARLLAFWSDHFTVAANGPQLRILVPDFIDSAIRPHITGRFPDMLRAATFHPAMLIYLNQVQSIGPNSRAGKRRDRGLNENLAREILELHTLGVDGGYAQTDVRSFAELLTGLSVDKGGFTFRQAISEPGPMRVLGKSYGSRSVSLANIEQALNDIALHPTTARHLARKLVVHFLGANDPNFEQRIADIYLRSAGDLSRTYAALLDDGRAWQPKFTNAKLPFEFMVSALRATGMNGQAVSKLSPKDIRNGFLDPLQRMGQPLFQPPGPDGWDEVPSTWITPPGLAARIEWAAALADRVADDHDPRAFLNATLADAASPLLTKAVSAAQNRTEGIALTLASPEFNRR